MGYRREGNGWDGGERPDTGALPGAQALLVFGMHRSGTSALTRVLNLRGAALSRQMVAPKSDNPRGYWEPAGLPAIHEELFELLGSAPTDFGSLDLHRLNADLYGRFEHQLIELLQRDFADARLFVIKEPRMCRFIPLWLDATRTFGAEPKAIIPIRDPREVAASLLRRNAFNPLFGHFLWLRHVLDAELYTREIDRVFVTYEDLLRDWQTATDRIAHTLKIAWPCSTEESRADVDAFLDKKLRHYEASEDAVRQQNETPRWVKEAFDVLAAIADETIADDAAARKSLDRIRPDFDHIRFNFDHIRFDFGWQDDRSAQRRRNGTIEQLGSTKSFRQTQTAALLEQGHEPDVRLADPARHTGTGQPLPRAAERIAQLERALVKVEVEYALATQACTEAYKKLERARQALRKNKKSMSWKLTKPIRFVAHHMPYPPRSKKQSMD
jgi:hypothetical protein